jgi:hypothetical protein
LYDPEKTSRRHKKYRAENHEKVLTKAATWRSENREKKREQDRQDRHKRARSQHRRAAKLRRTVSWGSPKIERLAYWLARAATQITGTKWSVDHIYPLQAETVSGLHVPLNLVVIPLDLNSAKRNRVDEKQLDGASLKNTLEEISRLILDYPELRLELHRHEGAILELLELG